MNTFDTLKQENQDAAALLHGDYAVEYRRVRKLLEEDVPQGMELEDALNGMIVLLLDAQKQEIPVPEVYGMEFDDFYRDLCSALPGCLSESDRRKGLHRKNHIVVGLVASISLLFLFFVLWENGTIGVGLRGMAFLMEDSGYTIHYDRFDRTIEAELDLVNLERNAGKVVYDDGEHRIVLTQVRMEPDGGYNAFFRNYGRFNPRGGTLVSPTRQVMTEQRYYTSESIGKMRVAVAGIPYESRVSASSGLNYKDGDEFGFHLFPTETYMNGTFLLEAPIRDAGGKVTIQLYDLVRTTWSRK